MPNTARAYRPLHLVPAARPKQIPATRRQGRNHSPFSGPHVAMFSAVANRVIRSRVQSRSMTRALTAACSQKARQKNGRASCRERQCKNGEHSGADVYEKKNNKTNCNNTYTL